MSSRQSPDFVLNAVRGFIGTLMWAPDEYLDAMTLILAVTHVKSAFTTVPYVLVTGEPESGKSTLSTDIPMLLASNPWGVDRLTTTEALRNKFLDRVPPDSVLGDDISKTFGEGGTRGSTSIVYQLGVNGYRRTGKVSVSRNGVTQDVPAFIVMFMNGIGNAVPRDLATRAIKFPLKPKPDSVTLRDALSVPVQREAEPLKTALHRWAGSSKKVMQQFMLDGVLRVHPLLNDRLRQLWGPVFAVAHAAGGSWPQRCLAAFLEMAVDESEKIPLLAEERVLLDAAKIASSFPVTVLFTAELIPALRLLPDGDFYDVDNDYLVKDLLPRALGPGKTTIGKSIAGRKVQGEARPVARILSDAAVLKEQLYPAPEDTGPDAVTAAMTLTEVS